MNKRRVLREIAGGYLLAGSIIAMGCFGYWYLELLYGTHGVKVYPQVLFVVTVLSPVFGLCIPRLCFRTKRSGWLERRWIPLAVWLGINAAYAAGRYLAAPTEPARLEAIAQSLLLSIASFWFALCVPLNRSLPAEVRRDVV